MTTKNSWWARNKTIITHCIGGASVFLILVGIVTVVVFAAKTILDAQEKRSEESIRQIEEIAKQHEEEIQQERRTNILNELEIRLAGIDRYLEPEHLNITFVNHTLNGNRQTLHTNANLLGLMVELKKIDNKLDNRIVSLSINPSRSEEETIELVELLKDFTKNADNYDSFQEWGEQIMGENKENDE